MSSLNRASLIGNLGKDPEARTMQSGGKVVTFSIATTEKWTDKASGERKEATQWHRIVIYNEPLGDVAERYLRKGSKVFVEGRIEQRKYVDQAGAERTTTEIVLRQFGGQMILLGDPTHESASRPAAANATGAARGAQPSWGGGAEAPRAGGGGPPPNRLAGDLDDDIPFDKSWQ